MNCVVWMRRRSAKLLPRWRGCRMQFSKLELFKRSQMKIIRNSVTTSLSFSSKSICWKTNWSRVKRPEVYWTLFVRSKSISYWLIGKNSWWGTWKRRKLLIKRWLNELLKWNSKTTTCSVNCQTIWEISKVKMMRSKSYSYRWKLSKRTIKSWRRI